MLKVEKTLAEEGVAVNNETKIYYSDCRLCLNRLRSKIMHNQIMINTHYTGGSSGNSREMFLQEQDN